MQPLALAAECAPITSQLAPRRQRLPGERQSGFMKCQCKLFCEIDGEKVRTCDGFNIKLRARSRCGPPTLRVRAAHAARRQAPLADAVVGAAAGQGAAR